MACHNRSTSLPMSSHPFVLKAEEELTKLRASAKSAPITYEIMLDAIQAVGRVYECINDLLCMSGNQIELANVQHRMWIERELDESIKLLDMCSTSRDNLDMIVYHIQGLESAIRRGESETIKSRLVSYIQLVRKANKDLKKRAAKNNESLSGDALPVISLLTEARDITGSIVRSIFSLLSKQAGGDKNGRLSLVSGFVHKKRVVCKKEQGNEYLDVATLRSNIERLDTGLEALFRYLIHCRVSLLNICSL